VRSLTSHNPIGLQGLLRDSFTLHVHLANVDQLKTMVWGYLERMREQNIRAKLGKKILKRREAVKKTLVIHGRTVLKWKNTICKLVTIVY
jgi:hypothetical protein